MRVFSKRLFDLFFALLFLIILSPLFLVIAVLIKIKLKGKVIFKQKRVGRYNKIFTLYKFKTIDNGAKNGYEGEVGDGKLPKFARFLRHSSIDELPQLFNILCGDMSFIGPRPKTIYEGMLMGGTDYIYRHAIKPGLTSWSVIHGRNNLANDRALQYDLEHVAKNSLLLDIKIFFKTIMLVFKRTGVNAPGKDSFNHLATFLAQKGYKNTKELQVLYDESFLLQKSQAKYLPLDVTKVQFKEKEKAWRKSRAQNIKFKSWEEVKTS